MSLAALTDLPLVLQLHLWPALLALALGPVAIYRRRRDLWHKVAGYTWVAAMALVAGGSFWLEAAVLPIAFGYGPIHLLSIVVLVGLWRGVAAARAGDLDQHRAQMRGLYWQALALAGLFTLLPGRVLNAAVFGSRPELGYLVIGLIGTALLLRALRVRRGDAAAG